ncbi:MAG: glycine--tRNA ligase subunit beta [Candidatus Latescibacterota bacterium]
MAPPTFQEIILRLQEYWHSRGCVLWQPYSEKVGAGTMNPATILRVLGPESWRVAYVEPSYRPDDGRFADNPNRMQMHTQFQVILKPDPGNPQELYLESLRAVGVQIERHDIRFVEDNWASPALGAWGLGWEVWLDGLEITQFTYFQQACGVALDPVAVELTYGLERIAMFLQGVRDVWSLRWNSALSYGEILRQQEVEHCQYAFHTASVPRLRRLYALYEAEAGLALERGLAVPALDWLLRCSHTFNLLDTRGAVGVTERAGFFARMRGQARNIALAWLAQRPSQGSGPGGTLPAAPAPQAEGAEGPLPAAADFVLEIGTEELPADDVAQAIPQLGQLAEEMLPQARLAFAEVHATGTPRRQILVVRGLEARQRDHVEEVKGPPARIAFDAEGRPTRVALGFAARQGVTPEALVRRTAGDTEYVFAERREAGRSVVEVLRELVPRLVWRLAFAKTMRWDSDGVSYSRPIRSFVALWGATVVPFAYARARSGRHARPLRHLGAPIPVPRAEEYLEVLQREGIVAERAERRRRVAESIAAEARRVGGTVEPDAELVDEVTDLVEAPFAMLGSFDASHLALPAEVLIAVMRKHQRYFAVRGAAGELLPHFVVVTNGRPGDPEQVRRGNEDVIRARYADAAYFVARDRARPLASHVPALKGLTFQSELGSMWHKTRRLRELADRLGRELLSSRAERAAARRAAWLAKADLVTGMVVEMTSLQGAMGRTYALWSGEKPQVAEAIREHYLPRHAGDDLPASGPGTVLAIADRLDSLASLFQVGLAPTGSADPYGLRRHALALIAILTGRQIDLSLSHWLLAALEILGRPVDEVRLRETSEFLRRRQEVALREGGWPPDVVAAVLAAQADRPVRAVRAVRDLTDLVARADWTDSFTAWSRVKRIVRSLPALLPLTVQDDPEPETRELYGRLGEVAPEPASDVAQLGQQLAGLCDPVNRFFEIVLVMPEDERVRAARLSLLQRIAGLPDSLADLALLKGF